MTEQHLIFLHFSALKQRTSACVIKSSRSADTATRVLVGALLLCTASNQSVEEVDSLSFILKLAGLSLLSGYNQLHSSRAQWIPWCSVYGQTKLYKRLTRAELIVNRCT